MTSLMYASKEGQFKCVKYLLKPEDKQLTGCEKKMQNNAGQTALYLAAANNHADCVKCLLDEVKLRTTDGSTALIAAAERGHEKCVKILVEYELGMFANNGRTALMAAAQHNHIDCCNLLLKEAKTKDNMGWTALMAAA